MDGCGLVGIWVATARKMDTEGIVGGEGAKMLKGGSFLLAKIIRWDVCKLHLFTRTWTCTKVIEHWYVQCT